MKKYIKNRYSNAIINGFLIILFYSSSVNNAYQAHFSFDSLFPATWYQKGLEASLLVWQVLLDAFEKNDDSAIAISFDLIIARLALAQFCINHMKQEGIICIPEDRAYFGVVLNKIKNLADMLVVTQESEDFVSCIQEIILNIQQQILQLP